MDDQKMVGRFEAHDLPSGETIYFDPGAHAYFAEIRASDKSRGGFAQVRESRLAGVSTVAKFADPPGDGLLHWSVGLDQQGIAEMAAADAKAERDLTWLQDPQRIKARLQEQELRWTDVRDRAATRGTNAHERGIAALAAGEMPDLADFDPDERPFVQAIFRWWQDRDPRVIHSETVTASISNGFSGRFDLLFEIDSHGETMRILLDAKTREKGRVRMTDFVQLAGYEAANIECGIGGTDQQIVLLLMPDGTYREETSFASKADFFAALNAYNTNKSLSRRMGQLKRKREQEAGETA